MTASGDNEFDQDPLASLNALSDSALIRARALAIAKNILNAAWQGAVLLNDPHVAVSNDPKSAPAPGEVRASSSSTEAALGEARARLQRAVATVAASSDFPTPGSGAAPAPTHSPSPAPAPPPSAANVLGVQSELEAVRSAVAHLRSSVDELRGALERVSEIARRVDTLSEAVVDQGRAVDQLRDDHSQVIIRLVAKTADLDSRVTSLESSAGASTLSSETPVGDEQSSDPTGGEQSGGSAVGGTAASETGASAPQPVALSPLSVAVEQRGVQSSDSSDGLLSGDVDLVLPRSADRVTLEVIVAVLREQPGVRVGDIKAHQETLIVPLSLARPMPLVPILRELPRVTTASLVPAQFAPVGSAPRHVRVDIGTVSPSERGR